MTAVRPSISSCTDMLAAKTQNSTVDSMTMSSPSCFIILKSSPNVKYGMTIEMKSSSVVAPKSNQNIGCR